VQSYLNSFGSRKTISETTQMAIMITTASNPTFKNNQINPSQTLTVHPPPTFVCTLWGLRRAASRVHHGSASTLMREIST